MKKNYASLFILSVLSVFVIFSCADSEDEIYVPVETVLPVTVDLTKVPFQKLSEYHFFEGELKNQKPAEGVLPFEPASALFTDYALKKRFVWMPKGAKATYNSDDKVLNLPVGAALIKSFYYDNVQNAATPNATRIIETRVMIKKADGWLFTDYVWNKEQTEAILNLDGSATTISWKDKNNVVKGTEYRIPSLSQCIVCHKSKVIVDNREVMTFIPIGIKPQNLNFDYNYGTSVKNQLTAWIEQGYLQDGFNFPTAENTTVNYADTSKSLNQRARSYVDANCSHCHQNERHCDYRPMRFAFKDSGRDEANMGVCVNTQDMQDFPQQLNKIVSPANIEGSMLYYRLNTTNENYRMPLHGRTIIHDEGLVLMRDWINTLRRCN